MQFFFRIEHMDLMPGNKRAGFSIVMATTALKQLSGIKVDLDDYQDLVIRGRERILRAGLLPMRDAQKCNIMLHEQSACPLAFGTDPVFGGSVGANPDELAHLSRPDGLDWLGDTIRYTAHNTDFSRDALALAVMVQTWGEWAHTKLYFLNKSAPEQQPDAQPQPPTKPFRP